MGELRALGIQVGLWMIAAHDTDEWCKTVKQGAESSRPAFNDKNCARSRQQLEHVL